QARLRRARSQGTSGDVLRRVAPDIPRGGHSLEGIQPVGVDMSEKAAEIHVPAVGAGGAQKDLVPGEGRADADVGHRSGGDAFTYVGGDSEPGILAAGTRGSGAGAIDDLENELFVGRGIAVVVALGAAERDEQQWSQHLPLEYTFDPGVALEESGSGRRT